MPTSQVRAAAWCQRPGAASRPASPKTLPAPAACAGNDIACGQQDWAGKPAPWCRVCGGSAAVAAACDKAAGCVAYDMEGPACGYLKAAKGPTKAAAGFASYARVG